MQTLELKKKEIVNIFLKKGLLISNDILTCFEDEKKLEDFSALIEKSPKNITVINKKIQGVLASNQELDLNWAEIERIEAISEKKGTFIEELFNQIKQQQKPISSPDTNNNIKVIFSYNAAAKKREVTDFVQYFNSRYALVSKLLKQRPELQNITSISRLANKKEREQVSIIGMVVDKQYTKNGNCILAIEDPTAKINALINKNKPELFKLTKDIVLDEVIGIVGVNGDNTIFSSNILFPDIPLDKEVKKTKDEVYAIFLSDLHVGSKKFLAEDFSKFLKWINCSLGNDSQKDIASKVKYIFIIGDLVDGCGVYPGQEKELEIKDIKEQYHLCAELLSKVPKHIPLVICPGNHDAMRLAEPQLPVYKDFAEPLYALPNAVIVSNPSLVNMHSSENFSGFDVLLYHGYSFDFYVSEVESIRNKGGYDRADLIMKFLLQKRHLAPSYTSTLYVPDTEVDNLVISYVPDFFVSGHIHKAAAANYKNTTLISGSCWQSKTAFQEKVGHNPEPSRVPLVNLQTREIKMLKFGK
ncbi:DNA-directed DNA polymerase II small subunit [Candidatus Woesearchaeota archaeon]|nr:DNA-directed DNA polymerase II small subunit [Candidatus Woesearchaeota archaeon]